METREAIARVIFSAWFKGNLYTWETIGCEIREDCLKKADSLLSPDLFGDGTRLARVKQMPSPCPFCDVDGCPSCSYLSAGFVQEVK
ncbi:MAG: hypothetical protein PHU23_06040 [Dehalococcoidales bacterium]|nr:hypothetical protein [Dehalococcoidales bacterium]